MRRERFRNRSSTGSLMGVAVDAPELALLAAIIMTALDDARLGMPDARAWLAGPRCRAFLSYMIPPEAELDAVQAQLLAMIPDEVAA